MDCDFRSNYVLGFSRWRFFLIEENLNGVISARGAKPSPSSSLCSCLCHVMGGFATAAPGRSDPYRKLSCRNASVGVEAWGSCNTPTARPMLFCLG